MDIAEKDNTGALIGGLNRKPWKGGDPRFNNPIPDYGDRDRKFINHPIPYNKYYYLKNNLIKEYILKNKKDYTQPKTIQIHYNPKYINLNVLPQLGISVDAKTRITADNIVEFAYPLAQFIEQAKPDYVFACDRGARIIGLAVHMMYRELYGTLPTQDHAIHFRKISRKIPYSVVRDALRSDVEAMLAAAESPTVLVLDDWVATGGTKTLVQEIFEELSGGKINLLYGVMRGRGADITGNKNSGAFGDWHDRPDLIGVDYFGSTLEPHKVKSPSAIEYRRKMSESIHRFVQQLKLSARKK